MLANRQTDRQTDRNTPLRYGGGVIMEEVPLVGTLAFSMHGQIAQAALACTPGSWFFSNDHSNRTPSSLSMILNKHDAKSYVTLSTQYVMYATANKQTNSGGSKNFHLSHFCGCAPGGLWPQIRTRPRFLYNAPTPKFHHPMFTRSEVIVLTNKETNKQADAAENIQRFSLRYDVG